MTIWEYMDRHAWLGTLGMIVVTFWLAHYVAAIWTSWALAANSWAAAYTVKWSKRAPFEFSAEEPGSDDDSDDNDGDGPSAPAEGTA